MSGKLDGLDLKAPPPPVEKSKETEGPETKTEEPEVKAEEKEKTLADHLAKFSDAPDEAQLETWKQTHGEVLCSMLSETEIFIFRPVTREEFVNLQAYLAQQSEQVSNFDVEVKITETCVLWASSGAVTSLQKKAGTFSTLHEQILQASNFVNPAYAGQFVIKL